MGAEKILYLGDFDTAVAPERIRTTLGSCVGVILHCAKTNMYGVAHIVLPGAPENVKAEEIGKFADTGIPALLAKMMITRGQGNLVTARLVGGANMFSNLKVSASMNIGVRNIESVKQILRDLNIKILGEELGGAKGRQVVVDSGTGKILISCIGEKPKEMP